MKFKKCVLTAVSVMTVCAAAASYASGEGKNNSEYADSSVNANRDYGYISDDLSISNVFGKSYVSGLDYYDAPVSLLAYDSTAPVSSSLSLMCSDSTASSITVKVVDVGKMSTLKYKYYIYNDITGKYDLYKTTTAVTCKFTGLSAGKVYTVKVRRYAQKDGDWVMTDAVQSITAATESDPSPDNEMISLGANAVVTSKKINANTYLNTRNPMSSMNNREYISSICQFKDKNGNVMFAYKSKDGKNLLVKMLRDDLTAVQVASIKLKQSNVGTVVGDSDGNFYVVWAKSRCSDKSETAVTLTKYDSSWKEIKSVSYKSGEIDTVVPFDSGNCDAAVGNGVLYCLFSRTMYNGGQGAQQIAVNTSSMTKTQSPVDFLQGRSFGQRVITDHNGDPWYANHGDSDPRAFETASKYSVKEVFHFYCGKSDADDMSVVNQTNAQLGGLADTSKGVYLVASSVKSMKKSGYESRVRNVFITSASGEGTIKDAVSRTGTVFGKSYTDKNIRWLTNYSTTYTAMNPQTVSTDDDRFIVMWEKYNTKTGAYIDSYYMVLTADGTVYQKATSLKKQRLNAYETPVYKDGCIYWLNADGSNIKAVKLTLDKVSLVNDMTGVNIASRDVTQVVLTWTKNSSATGYQIQIKKDGKWINAVTLKKNTTTSYTLPGLSASTQYSIRIRAYKTIDGTDYYGNYKTISVVTKTNNMTGVKLAKRGINRITLSWKENSSASGYQIQVKKDGKWITAVTLTKNTTTSYTLKNLSAGTKYSVRIRAYKTVDGTRHYGSYKTLSVVTKPSSVSGLEVASRGINQVTLSWKKNSSATGYQIQVKKGGTWSVAVTSDKNTLTSYTLKNLSAGGKYSVRIRTYKVIDGVSFYGDYEDISVVTKPSNMSGVKLKTRTKNTLTVQWSKNKSATGYQIQIKKNGKWVSYTVGADDTSYQFKNLSKNTTYSIRIRAFKTVSGKNYYGNYTTVSYKTAQ